MWTDFNASFFIGKGTPFPIKRKVTPLGSKLGYETGIYELHPLTLTDRRGNKPGTLCNSNENTVISLSKSDTMIEMVDFQGFLVIYIKLLLLVELNHRLLV